MANDCVPLYEPGARITARASAAVTGKRLVKISGNRTSGPGLSSTSEGGTYQVATADAAGRAFGVAAHDAPIDGHVTIIKGGVVPVYATAAVAAFQEVEVGAGGSVVPLATGRAVGVALTAAAINTDAEIELYQ